jgi:hypothetical protein
MTLAKDTSDRERIPALRTRLVARQRSLGGHGAYGVVVLLADAMGTIEQVQLGEQVVDALDSGGDPLVVECSLMGESEGRAAEIGECKR